MRFPVWFLAVAASLASSENASDGRVLVSRGVASSQSLVSWESDEIGKLQDELDQLLAHRSVADRELQTAIRSGASFLTILQLFRERIRLAADTSQLRTRLNRARAVVLAKRRTVAKKIIQASEPITADLLFRCIYDVYGDDMADRVASLEKSLVERFQKPYLKPTLQMFATDGPPSGVEAKIYQNLHEQTGTLLKEADFTVVMTVSNFTGERLHLGLDLRATNETLNRTESSFEDDLTFQKDVVEQRIRYAEQQLKQQVNSTSEEIQLLKDLLDESNYEVYDGILVRMDALRSELKDKIKRAKDETKTFHKEIKRQRELIEKLSDMEIDNYEKQIDLIKKIQKKQEHYREEEKKKQKHIKEEEKKKQKHIKEEEKKKLRNIKKDGKAEKHIKEEEKTNEHVEKEDNKDEHIGEEKKTKEYIEKEEDKEEHTKEVEKPVEHSTDGEEHDTIENHSEEPSQSSPTTTETSSTTTEEPVVITTEETPLETRPTSNHAQELTTMTEADGPEQQTTETTERLDRTENSQLTEEVSTATAGAGTDQ